MQNTEHGTAVSTLLGLISSAHRDLHHWRPNQQPQYAEVKTLPLGHQFMSNISDAELTSHGGNVRPLDLMCLEGAYSLCDIWNTNQLFWPSGEIIVCSADETE